MRRQQLIDIQSLPAQILGIGAAAALPSSELEAVSQQINVLLTKWESQTADLETTGAGLGMAFSDLEQRLLGLASSTKTPLLQLARWPNNKRFAVHLSHDVDQIHDRELFRWLGDINHLRRTLTQGERGIPEKCLKRIVRPIFSPRDPFGQFVAIRKLEGRYGWQSTFYLLEDKYWGRLGGRFNWEDPVFKRISDFLLAEDCELGIHGSAYEHLNPQWWRAKCERFERLFQRRPLGSRNHYLTLKVPDSWKVQAAAGLLYDSTFADPAVLGPPGGFCFPFEIPGVKSAGGGSFIQLPLSIMDTTLFRYHGLDYQGAMNQSLEILQSAKRAGGLATLLWHNNFFNEEEYVEWAKTYEDLLFWLSKENAWVGTGAQIVRWWRARAGVRIQRISTQEDLQNWVLTCSESIDDLVLVAQGMQPGYKLIADHSVPIATERGIPALHFPRLAANARVICKVVSA